ncbi:ornithine cyclodeaminase [Maritimibacter sp. UBA3975]|uniref:ornithine cyclodeaminase family protein n=1 Tax=Maritimibacter sp. UBA3975 TaxID=1946833 RepID=UPI000C0BA56A|nr:ornithine cyclodeaminase [Maritimibacter sp. UBA3975]MAM62873.1 ornithine cyclodeaminase [Maritimibacter sp.]|tara:strand:+ start:56662 stop:57597 length:936 start_codon:yes stop_codon:yes gene_type:complete
MQTRFITYEDAAGKVSWPDVISALEAGHRRPRAEIRDLFLGPAEATLLNRAAYIEGLGYGVKAVTVVDANAARGLPTVQGAMTVFAPDTGAPTAIVESRLVTEYKTAADSVLGARLLARPESRHLVIAGAGVVARSLVHAYSAGFPGLERITLWARRPEQAEALAAELSGGGVEIAAATDLAQAVGSADIVASATMARVPFLQGDWVAPGTHVDLIGAFKADMREADDTLITRATLFADSRDTTLHHIGEYLIPLKAGVIGEADLVADLYDLVPGSHAGRAGADEITLYKNGGGAHLDLMTAMCIAGALDA